MLKPLRKYFLVQLCCFLFSAVIHAQVPPGNALYFDGINDYISIPHSSLLKPSAAITIEAWVYPLNIRTNQYYEIYRKEDGTARQLLSFQEYGTVLSFGLGTSAGYSELDVSIQPSWYEGQCVHIAATYDGSIKRLYRNGVLIGSQNVSGAISTAGTAPAIIGASGGLSEFFQGGMDEIRIWNVARSETQIRAGMVDTVNASTLGLIAYYRFDAGVSGGDNSGLVSLADQTINGLNGTLNNFSLVGTSSNWVESYAMVVPTALSPDNVTSNGFTAKWLPPVIGTVSYYLLDVATDPGFNNRVPGFSSLNVGNVSSYLVSGLPAGLVYYYRVSAIKSPLLLQGAYSATIIVFTGIIPFSPPVTDISRVEYFLDTDPGIGNATELSVTPGSNIQDAVISIDPATLTEGVHRLYVRVRNTAGNWSLVNTQLFYKPFSGTNPPVPDPVTDITRVEYYLDTDPGIGNAAELSITPGSNIQDAIIAVDPATLTEGVHRLYVRARNAVGNWSLVNTHLFYKPYSGTNPPVPDPVTDITRVEYYLDTDPGIGNATELGITPGSNIQDAIIAVDPATLTEGVHRLYVRARNAVGNWSLVNTHLFYKPYSGTNPPALDPVTDITRVEYYLDTDPGIGNATELSITPGSNIQDAVISIDPSTLTDGVHRLYVRARNTAGNWSLVNTHLFYKPYSGMNPPAPDPVTDITRVEYYLDTDPGIGNATELSITPGSNIQDAVISIDPSTLTEGVHRLYVRARNAAGNWSLVNTQLFYKPYAGLTAPDPPGNPPKIVRVEYYVDTDPGQGNGTAVGFTATNELADLVIPVNIGALQLGSHTLHVRAMDSTGKWSMVNSKTFTKEPPSALFLTIGTVEDSLCAGGPVAIPFELNAPFDTNNIFTAQLSNNNGVFSNPVNIGTLTGYISDTIFATIPANTPVGNGYRIRILSTAPLDTSDMNEFPLTILRIPQQSFSITGDNSVCFGSQNYSASTTENGASYIWQLSGGGTLSINGATATVVWNSAGVFTLTLQSFNSCGYGPLATRQVTVNDLSPVQVPVVTNAGRMLVVTASTGVTYQWYRNNNAITGATGVSYHATLNGAYSARYVNNCGESPVSNTITFNQDAQSQSINFPVIENKTYGDSPFILNATASSLLPVSYRVVSGPAIIMADTVQITGAGNVTIESSQVGDTLFSPAAVVNRTFSVTRASQTVSFDSIPDRNYGSPSFAIYAVSSSSLPVTYSVVSGPVTISGSTVYIQGAGTAVIRARQQGNQNYLPAESFRTFCIYSLTPDSITGFRTVCVSSQVYRIYGAINGVVYHWELSGGGSLSSSTGSEVTISWTQVGAHQLRVYATADCGPASVADTIPVDVTPTVTPGTVTVLAPANGTVISSFPATFFWSPVSDATLYDLYIWKDGTTEPGTPAISGISQVGVVVNQAHLPAFAPGNVYKWKVVARNACASASGPIYTFSVSELPNLIVNNIQTPASVFSGQQADITVEIKNSGNASSGSSSWVDAVYLSADTILNKIIDSRIGNRNNLTALDAGQSYVNTIPLNLPVNVTGNYYLIVETDTYNTLLNETSNTDNTSFKPLLINLTPPPDLQVMSVVTPGDVFSGQTLNVQYTVENKGAGNIPNTSWNDRIYISPDQVFDINGAIQIGQFNRSGALPSDSSYSRSVTVTVPAQLFGVYYIYVVTDANNVVYEHTFENNNSRGSDPVNVFLTPPPDLVITQANVPDRGTGYETLQVTWTVQNQGATRPPNTSWQDAVYISAQPVFNPATASRIGQSGAPGSVIFDPDATYNNSVNVTIPGNLNPGMYYVYLMADYNNVVFEYQNENNNVIKDSILVVRPDFVVAGINAAGAATSGSSLNIDWTVRNQGQGKVIAGRARTDKVWLSDNVNFAAGNKILLGSQSFHVTIDTGASTVVQQAVGIPNGISGNYYLFAETDGANQFVEENESNNVSTAFPLSIELTPPPDLRADTLIVGAEMISPGQKVAIRYQVTNAGTGDIIGKVWKDKVYVSRFSQWGTGTAYLIKTIERVQTLMSSSSYEVSDSVSISAAILQSFQNYATDCYFYIFSDADNNVYEFNAEGNNIKRGVVGISGGGGNNPVIVVVQQWPSDLGVTSVSSVPADTVFSGTTASVSWNVINHAYTTSYYSGFWYDGIYLSLDTIWDNNDLFITDKIIYGPLERDSSYNQQLVFTIPNGLSGNYHLLLVADHKDNQHETIRTNNYRLIRDGSGNPKPLHIKLTPSPDLIVTFLQTPQLGYAGQSIKVVWKVENIGVGQTPAPAWSDRLFLSTGTNPSASGGTLLNYQHNGRLNPGESYTDSAEVFLPANASGSYYLVMKTDNNNIIYEHNTEQNNAVNAPIFVVQPPPADLVAEQISVPANITVGDTILVTYTIRNSGQNPATGYLRNGLYFSADSVLGLEDKLMADPQYVIHLLPGSDTLLSRQFKVSGLTPGTYYPIVRADLLNNIIETDENNNYTADAGSVEVQVRELPLNVLTAGSLYNYNELYYRVEIPDSLAGETLMVSLMGDSLTGANEMYIRFGAVPSRVSYDFSYDRALSGNQEIVIPVLQKGTYYLLVYGATSSAVRQDVTLLARKIGFEVHLITANEGGNTGAMTVKIKGSKFESGMIATLVGSSGNTIQANSVYFSGSTLVYATFNLAGRPTGQYDVRLEKVNGSQAVLNDGFTIVQGSGGGVLGGNGSGGGFFCNITNVGVESLLGINLQYPDATRTRRAFPMTINFGNSGNVDIPVPTRVMISVNGDPIAFTPEGLDEGRTELYIEFREQGGPPNVLRPGATGSIIIYTRSIARNTLLFRLYE